MNIKSLGVLPLLSFASFVSANPSFSWGVSGSSFIISAENKENIGYQCTASYMLYYSQYGTPGSQRFNPVFYVAPHSNGNVSVTNTSWAASTLRSGDVNINCVQKGSLGSVTRPGGGKQPSFTCPAGLTMIGNMYGESESGGHAFLEMQYVTFPHGFELDESYRQSEKVDTAGGGAHSEWNGMSGIPNGVYIYATGGHYWAVGVKSGGAPKVQYNDDASPRSLSLRNYCGPEGWPGPGCNVNVFVCAKRN